MANSHFIKTKCPHNSRLSLNEPSRDQQKRNSSFKKNCFQTNVIIAYFRFPWKMNCPFLCRFTLADVRCCVPVFGNVVLSFLLGTLRSFKSPWPSVSVWWKFGPVTAPWTLALDSRHLLIWIFSEIVSEITTVLFPCRTVGGGECSNTLRLRGDPVADVATLSEAVRGQLPGRCADHPHVPADAESR